MARRVAPRRAPCGAHAHRDAPPPTPETQTAVVVAGSVTVGAALLWPLAIWYEVRKCEKPKYAVVRALAAGPGDRRRFRLGFGQAAEVRRYAPMLVAEVEVEGTMRVGVFFEGGQALRGHCALRLLPPLGLRHASAGMDRFGRRMHSIRLAISKLANTPRPANPTRPCPPTTTPPHPSPGPQETSAQGFRKIARFIFGANTAASGGASQAVAMTSPVREELVVRSVALVFVAKPGPFVFETGSLPSPSARP
jgi:hypothetical protein